VAPASPGSADPGLAVGLKLPARPPAGTILPDQAAHLVRAGVAAGTLLLIAAGYWSKRRILRT
jgi:hypothetical protein